MKSKGAGNFGGPSRIHSGNLGGAFLLNYSLFLIGFVILSVDCYLDGDGSSTDVLALESDNGLLLLLLIADIDETVALTLARTTILPADNTSRNDVDTGFGKQIIERGVINVETKVGDKEHRLGGLASGFFASNAIATERAPLANRLRLAFRGRGGGLSFAIGNCYGDPRLPRGPFLLLLGFGRFAFGRRSVLRLGFTIGLGFGNLSGDGLGASPARAPAGFPVFPLPFFLIGRLCYLDDDLAVVKLLLIKEVDGILGSFSRGEGDEPIARGPSSAQDDLGGDDVALNGLEKRLQPLIRGRIRKISNEDLERGNFFGLRNRRHALLGDGGGGGIRHFYFFELEGRGGN